MREKTGIPFYSLYQIEIQVRQLSRDGLSSAQIERAIRNLHPKLMENLTLDARGNPRPLDPRFVWQRRTGWEARDHG